MKISEDSNMNLCMLEQYFHIVDRFDLEGSAVDIQEYGSGNVNDTFLVTLNSKVQNKIILQRMNRYVFPHPELIMLNLRVFTNHICRSSSRHRDDIGRRWEVMRIITTRDESDYYVDTNGDFWRGLSYIGGAKTYTKIQDIKHATEIGYALGKFHSLTTDLSIEKLQDPLKGFHITPQYLQHYDRVLQRIHTRNSLELEYCFRFVDKRRQWASILENAKNRGKLVVRTIHGDPQAENILIDDMSGQAISIIDLDTIKPGLIQYDIGDCLRSACNPAGEETNNIDSVYFETDICRAALDGYLSVASKTLNQNDYLLLYDSIRIITFELGLRFLTDYLEGNEYFKAKHAKHNLLRALVQFKLVESVEKQETSVRAIIDDLKKRAQIPPIRSLLPDCADHLQGGGQCLKRSSQ